MITFDRTLNLSVVINQEEHTVLGGPTEEVLCLRCHPIYTFRYECVLMVALAAEVTQDFKVRRTPQELILFVRAERGWLDTIGTTRMVS